MTTYTEARATIEAVSMKPAQKRACVRMLDLLKKNAQTTLEGDVVDFEITVSKFAEDTQVSFCGFADSKLYIATVSGLIAPRGGIQFVAREVRFADSWGKMKFLG